MLQAHEGDWESAYVPERLLLFGTVYWLLVGTYVSCLASPNERVDFVGKNCLVMTILFSLAPVYKIPQIYRDKESSAIYRPALFINMANNIVWLIYGFFVLADVNTWAPMAFGLIMNILLMIITIVYPTKVKERPRRISVSNEGNIELEDAPEFAKLVLEAGNIRDHDGDIPKYLPNDSAGAETFIETFADLADLDPLEFGIRLLGTRARALTTATYISLSNWSDDTTDGGRSVDAEAEEAPDLESPGLDLGIIQPELSDDEYETSYQEEKEYSEER